MTMVAMGGPSSCCFMSGLGWLGLVPVGETLSLAYSLAELFQPSFSAIAQRFLLKSDLNAETTSGFCKCLAAHAVQVLMIRNSNLLRRNSTKPN